MTLSSPILDDRTFQDIVDEAKKRIPHYCKEWTDHNLSDPGITLVELFAWVTEIMLYRMNQVPQLHYVKFLEMLGVSLHEPSPAKAPVTFWLSAPQATMVTIPAQTEVASTQTETEASIIFSTDQDLIVQPPNLVEVLSRVSSSKSQSDADKKVIREHNLRRLESGFEGSEVFSSVPQIDDALYFAFNENLGNHILGFDFDFDPAGGAGIDPSLPPYSWEASSGKDERRWLPCQVELDTTKGMNTGGKVRLHLPDMGKYTVDKKTRYWVRVRIKEINSAERLLGMRSYDISPRMRKLSVHTWGGTVMATHARPVKREHLGQSDGSPGQRFYLQFTPILKRQEGENLLVLVDGEAPQAWQEVRDFASSGSQDKHYTLDPINGELRFGPAVRQPDGTMKLYGAVPPRSAQLVFSQYRFGGGQQGNVQARILNTLKTGIPFIAKVSNRESAWGGLDAESLEAAMMRAPALLRSRDRAVTEEDYEFLARQALPAAIGRVKCLQPRPSEAGRIAPGQVYVLVIPRIPQPDGFIEPEKLQPKEEDIRSLDVFLEERRLLTTRLDIRPPAYYWVAAHVKMRAAPGIERSEVENQVLNRLYKFLNPISGGPDGKGWPFGRHLFVSDVYQCLQGIPNIQFIRSVELFAAKAGGEASGEAIETLELVSHGVIASGLHSVEFV